MQHNIFISWYYHTPWWHCRQLAVHITCLVQSTALLWILFELCYMQCMLFSVFAIKMASRYRNMSTQGTAGKWKHVTLTILQKLEIIRRLESGENHWGFMTSYSVGSSTIYDTKKWKYHLWSFMASSESVKDCFKWQTQEPKLAQMDKVYKWLTAIYAERKPMNGLWWLIKLNVFTMK